MATKERHYLTLEKKVELIKFFQKNPGTSVRSLGEQFGCGRTQVGKILKRRESLLGLYESNASSSRIHTSVIQRPSKFEEINKALYDWYKVACSKNIYPGGPQLIEKGKEIAEKLHKPGFKGSRGWLEKWKKRYNVKQVKVCGESSDVRGETVDSWKERLPEIIDGYEQNDIWNMDETGVFWQALPDRGFGQKGKQCFGGKKSKKRVTLAFFVTASGKKEKPVFIWKSETPRCLRKFDKSVLPVEYYSQKTAWMTGEIMDFVLTKLNRRLSRNSQSILLIMDNAGCHPESLVGKYSNIKICFLPANTTSKLQPLDLGIIQNFKVHYRHLFLRYVLSKIDECEKASDVVKSINILMALRWIAQAWSQLKSGIITKCFRKAGILNANLDVVSSEIDRDDDPFIDADMQTEVQGLIEQTMPSSEHCNVDEYLDDGVPVCTGMDSEHWETDFFLQLRQEEHVSDDDDEIDADNETPSLKITNDKDAIESLDNVRQFLESRGRVQEALQVGSTVDALTSVRLQSSKQTTLNDYFPTNIQS